MSFFKILFDSLSSVFSSSDVSTSSPVQPPPSNRAMEVPPSASAVVSERAALKLKGYFELAKEQIDKAVRCEEWGLPDDAISYYQNAHKVLLEAKAARVPDVIPSSERDQVKTYQQKLSKWQARVEERLKVLGQRAGSSTQNPSGGHAVVARTEVPTLSGSRRPKAQISPSSRVGVNNHSNHSKGISTPSPPARVASKSNSGEDPLIEMINTTIVDRSPAVKWDDVAGLDKAKQALMEMVILPTKRRDLFTGLRRPARGLLLFGPPGNGKTMLAKAVASESEATFFNVSASSLTSKWVGEAEKLVRTLFQVAVDRQPSVIFMDEIDSVMSTRQANEHDASRRLKSEFLIQFDGVTSNQDALVIVIGATNKPQELDDAVLRRLVKRIYVPLPDATLRKILFKNQLKGQSNSLSGCDLDILVAETDGYSGSDMRALCEEAAMMPIRELGPHNILTIKANQLRPLKYEDFKKAMLVIRPSLQKSRWEELEKWNEEFGSN
ncbi:Spastin [Rhynchospora pubera]|uniref:microtubule-severing ATPase n=1 Tax=Rhynchospora pubera TaxID=906938 RepID=A0AAV8E4U5_9POAL|nr:Spastin [Rhynchospora pubera]